MDQNRLFIAIAVSVMILLGFQFLLPHQPTPQPAEDTKSTPSAVTAPPSTNPSFPGTQPVAVAPPQDQKDVPRLPINAPKVSGSVNLAGGRFDDLVLRDYHEEVSPESPLVRLLEPRVDPQPYYVQFGWTGDNGVKVPDLNTVWTAPAGTELSNTHPVTLSWDNGAGQVFQIVVSVDDNYMFAIQQTVQNNGTAPISVHPWARIRRDYKPVTGGYYILHEGLLGVLNGTLQEQTYDKAKSESEKANGGPSLDMKSTGGWLGITDKYWLTAIIPDQATPVQADFRHLTENGADRYQADMVTENALTAAPGAAASYTTRMFAGAKVVQLLDHYGNEYKIPDFWKAVDFGWFWFLTRPIFYAIDWIYHVVGNFGVAIMIFTVFVKALFFPLANKSYRSMSKMKLLGPKMQAIRERLKDEPQKMQSEIMALYKTEKVNPAAGCLPMVVQIPVFFSLYKVIFVTIEMRHAPFFGWIHDLSAVDPTNIFNLFGLIPWDPAAYSPFLHLGIWPLIMGCTMFFQQKLNPPPPDPVQAKIFQFMPIIFTFMLARFPAGLVIYWSWNNTLTMAQQWMIMRRAKLTTKPQMVRS